MKLLVIDNDGGNGLLGFIMRAQACGHDVRWSFIKPLDWSAKPVGRGIVRVVDDWRDHVRWADLVIMGDNTRCTQAMDALRARGQPVIGATTQSASWELQRQIGQGVFRKHGIPVPPYRAFSNYDDAIGYVEREGRAFVSKPNGDTDDKALSYVAKSPADLIYMLRRWKGSHKHKDSFILQEKVSGVEMAVGAFVGPDGFAPGWCENFEEKKLMPGGLGPNTGEMGTALMFVRGSALANKVLKPLEEAIVRTGHTGYVDVNCIVDDKGVPWPLEFTMRFGYPTFQIQQALAKGDVAEWLGGLAEGSSRSCFTCNSVAVGVVMAHGAFPHGRAPYAEIVGIPLYGCEEVMDDVYFAEVMAGKAPHDIDGKVVDAPCYCTAGDYILTATGTGDTVSAARGAAYRRIGKLSMPASPFWRIDIGQHLRDDLPKVQERGYAKGWSYS